MNSAIRILKQVSDHSLLVSFADEISPAHHRYVLRLTNLLLSENKLFIRNVHPAYTSVLVSFDPLRVTFTAIEQYVESSLQRMEEFPVPPQREIEIPVCYGGEFGPDLADVASFNHLSPEEVIRIHSSAEYLVYFLGFSPGFPYLGGMPGTIATSRLSTPRMSTPAGSVAIGGQQTGIYPVNSPGGWRIIGRTPLKLFRPDKIPLTLLMMGDHVRFHLISEAQYKELT